MLSNFFPQIQIVVAPSLEISERWIPKGNFPRNFVKIVHYNNEYNEANAAEIADTLKGSNLVKCWCLSDHPVRDIRFSGKFNLIGELRYPDENRALSSRVQVSRG
jgi:hypothetical protein